MGRLQLASLAFGVSAVTVLCLVPAPMAAASNWTASIQLGSTAESNSGSPPAAPSGVTATCTSPLTATIAVTWNPVSNASTYDVYQSTTSSSAGYVMAESDVSGTSWTTGSLTTGNYWFEVSASVGAFWAGPNSIATAPRTVTLDLDCS